MKILVCGGRDFKDGWKMHLLIDKYHNGDATIIHGGARGADLLADKYAKKRELDCLVFKADWNKYGKSAGPIRNQQMLDEGNPDLVIAFPTKNSVGTWDMIRRSKKAGIETVVVNQ